MHVLKENDPSASISNRLPLTHTESNIRRLCSSTVFMLIMYGITMCRYYIYQLKGACYLI